MTFKGPLNMLQTVLGVLFSVGAFLLLVWVIVTLVSWITTK